MIKLKEYICNFPEHPYPLSLSQDIKNILRILIWLFMPLIPTFLLIKLTDIDKYFAMIFPFFSDIGCAMIIYIVSLFAVGKWLSKKS